MNNYRIMTVPGEPEEQAVPQLQLDRILWTPDFGIRAFGWICHDAENLYVHLQAEEEYIRAELTTPLSPVNEDSCLEFFFMPEGEDRYLNFEVNPNGCLHIGFGRSRRERVCLVRRDAQEFFRIRPARTENGWAVRYRIPLVFLRLLWPAFTFSGTLRANVYKCGDLTVHEHYLSWNPVVSETPDFHRPEDFGQMTFE